MRRNLFVIQLLFLSLVSCSEKDTQKIIDTETIAVNLKGTELYQYKIADAVPTEGGYKIEQQAEHYQISKMDWGTYHFQAKEGFKGSEKVEVVLSTSIGDDNTTSQKRWIFDIIVE